MTVCRTNRRAKLIAGQIQGHLLPADSTPYEREPDDLRRRQVELVADRWDPDGDRPLLSVVMEVRAELGLQP